MDIVVLALALALLGLVAAGVGTYVTGNTRRSSDALASASEALKITQRAENLYEELKASSEIVVNAIRMADKRAKVHSTLLAELAKELPESFVLVDKETGDILVLSTEAEKEASIDLPGTKNINDWVGLWHMYRPDGTPITKEQWPITRIQNGETIHPDRPDIVYSIQPLDGAKNWFVLHGHPMYDEDENHVASVMYFRQAVEGLDE